MVMLFFSPAHSLSPAGAIYHFLHFSAKSSLLRRNARTTHCGLSNKNTPRVLSICMLCFRSLIVSSCGRWTGALAAPPLFTPFAGPAFCRRARWRPVLFEKLHNTACRSSANMLGMWLCLIFVPLLVLRSLFEGNGGFLWFLYQTCCSHRIFASNAQ